jgi:hypothetical protein
LPLGPESEEPGPGIARLRLCDGDRAKLDEAETERFPPSQRHAIFVQTRRQSHRIGEINPENSSRSEARWATKDRAQKRRRKNAKLAQDETVSGLGIQPKEQRPKNRGVKGHFPMQKVLKIFPRISSVSAVPTTSPAASSAPAAACVSSGEPPRQSSSASPSRARIR